MIQDLLPRYYEVFGDNPKYKVLRSIIIDGHEVAWMQCDGWFVNLDVEGETYSENKLFCECDFTENVGWKMMPNGMAARIIRTGGECLRRQAAQHLRHLELRAEYLKRFETHGDKFFLSRFIPEIVFDLIEKVKTGEFIGESGEGAPFWGGYFYAQTIAHITGQFEGDIWKDVHQLVTEKKIGLEGAVIQPYREPPPPAWEESFRIKEEDGWTGIASLPTHSKMEQVWQLDILKPDGTPAHSSVVGPHLTHQPTFGPDVDDVASAGEELKKLICAAKAGN